MVEIPFTKQLITNIKFGQTHHIVKQASDYSKSTTINDLLKTPLQKKIYLTFDIETIISKLSYNPGFYSNILSGSLYIANELEKRGLKATFFISLSSKTKLIPNKEYLEEISLIIRALRNFKNIKLQPHLHTFELPLSFDTSSDAFSKYNLEEKIEILQWGKQFFEKFGIEVDSFRSGSYSRDDSYYSALEKSGYKYSSMLLTDVHIDTLRNCSYQHQPFHAEHDIVEYPVTSVLVKSIKNDIETLNLSPDFFTLDSMRSYIDELNYVNLNFHSFSIFNNRFARENHSDQFRYNMKYLFLEKPIIKILRESEIETIDRNTVFKDELINWLDYIEKKEYQTFFIGE